MTSSTEYMLGVKEVEQGTYQMPLRAQLIISHALTLAIKHLVALEDRDDLYPKNGEHAHPSNREDMEILLGKVFPLWARANAEYGEEYKKILGLNKPLQEDKEE